MTDPAASATPSRPLSSRRIVLTVAGVAVVVALIVAGAVAATTASSAPRDAIVAYVEAIRDGDVEAANALAFGDDAPAGSLDDAERISDVIVSDDSIESTTVGDSPGAPRQETFAVTYVVGGETVETSLTVTEVGPTGAPRWSLSDDLVRRVDVSLAVETETAVLVGFEAILAGQSLDLRQSQPDELHLYPGVYAVEPEAGSYASAERRDVLVGDDDVRVELPVLPSDDLSAVVEDEALTTLADCADAAASLTMQCGGLLLWLGADVADSLGLQSGNDADAFQEVVWTVESPSTQRSDVDAWAVDVAAVVRATYPIGGTMAIVDFPVQSAWSYAETPGDEPRVTVNWYDPADR